jgi:hypothetical protein
LYTLLDGGFLKNAGHGSVGGGTTTSHDRDYQRRYAAPLAGFFETGDPPPAGIMNRGRLNLVKFSCGFMAL